MTDSPQADGNEALLTLISMAQQEVSDALVEFAPESADEFRSLCANQLENLVWASSQAGLDDLYLVTEAVLSGYGDESLPFSAERGSEFLNWLADASHYLESSDNADSIVLLLGPLPEDTQAAMGAILGATDDADELTAPANPCADAPAFDALAESENADDSWAEEASTAIAESESPTDSWADEAGIAADDWSDEEDIDTDNILGMLAYELREVAPELAELAQAIASADSDDPLTAAAAAYWEIVNRVASVAQELELQGLTIICQFIEENLALTTGLQPAQRVASLELLQHWPRVIIEHLLNPQDDARCIAVIDYLEDQNWPQPLPYSNLRALIEGLTRALEISGLPETELREIEACAEDVALQMSADASPELIEAFFDESPGHAETFSRLMVAIGDGEDVEASVEAAQRIAHTLKGSGNLLGVKGIANLAHHIEDIFDYIARHKIMPPEPLALTLQEAADTIESMIESLQGMAPPPEGALRVLQDVLDWANRIDSGQMRHEDYNEAAPAVAPAADQPVDGDDAATTVEEERRSNRDDETAAPSSVADSVRVPLKLLDNIFRIVSETAITSGQIQERLSRLEADEKLIRNNDGSMQQLRYELENLVSIRAMASRHRGSMTDASSDFDPLEMDEYDEFYGATHAYIESVADSREILRGFSGEVNELDGLFLEQQRLNKELQQLVMTTRMVPVSNIASRLQRTLRQVCRTTGKQVVLSILGRDLMLDGDVLNKLADPLMHMLRNAVDHGIETSELREASGKAPLGQVVLKFEQQGNNVVVSCSDDGGGLDYPRIRSIAIERGLLSEQDSADNRALAGLILQSGFSTREQITHVSGRGVGMDVVNNTIQSLNGSMDIGEAPGGGMLITMRLPITLLTSHCLLVGVGKDNQYAIPTISLTQILSPGNGQIGLIDGKLSYQLDQELYPAFTLNSLIGVDDAVDENRFETSSVLLVQAADGIAAVCVERVITSYDLVVKNMGAYIKSVSGIAGVSMLGNGEVVAVLDLSAMLQAQGNRNPMSGGRSPAAAATSEPDLPRILIVDDSLSVRNSLSQLMQDSGYQPILARDGREAVIILDSEKPDVVLTDLEMPRMNGLELVSYIRNSSAWKNLPTVMITSRNMAKHRQQAEQAGVNRFIPKPFSDDEVLDAIDEQLAALA
ncbi:MAG: response regulator [Gammaproteobacteria bacterium]|nr:response regulator [Gammaproteobacteria bacterium]